MVSWTINLKILPVGHIQYPKGMYNSEFCSLTTSQPASTINVVIVFQLTPPKHTVIKKNSKLYMPFGYCMSPTSNIFRFIVHDTIMTERFCSHYRVIFSATQIFGQFQIRNWPSPPQFEARQD